MTCAELWRMYERFCAGRGWQLEVLDLRERSRGLRAVDAIVTGAGSLERLGGEAGEHICQRKTRTRKADRIHTTGVSVRVLPLGRSNVETLREADVQIEFFRGSGPGGQHRNVTDTAVRARHLPSGEMATVTSGRSQADNRERALRVLTARVAEAAASRRAAELSERRRSQSGAVRTYDHVRGMIRDRSHGKSHQLRQVLDGKLDLLS